MPNSITFSSGNTIEWVYDAAGMKLRKIVKQGATVQYEQTYAGGLEYRKNGTGSNRVEAIYHAEGRYLNLNAEVNNTLLWQKEYALRDHLGNTRMMFADKNANGIVETPGEIVQENHYYPFGLGYEGPWLMNDAVARDNKYQYNGKEWNDDWGLKWNDYGARWYDAAIGRWDAVDPLAVNFASINPYNYSLNNPIRFIDPNGMAPADPPDGQVSWVWFTPKEVKGNYYQTANYQNVSESHAKQLNAQNSQTEHGIPITKTTYDFLATGESKNAIGYPVPDLNSGSGKSAFSEKDGAGEAAFEIPLSTTAETVSAEATFDMSNQPDNLSISIGDQSSASGNQIGKGSISLTGNLGASKSIGLTVTPMNPNPEMEQIGQDPLKDSRWSVTVKYSTGNTLPVYSSQQAQSTRANSRPGEELGSYRKN